MTERKRSLAKPQASRSPQLDLESYIPGLLVWLTNRIVNGASNTYRAKFGIGTSDWRVLSYLGVYGTGTAAQVCQLIDMDKAAASRSVKVLESAGYVQATPRAGRRLELSVTDRGRRLYEEMVQVALAREEALLAEIHPTERAIFIRLIHRMLAHVAAANAAGDEMLPKRYPDLH